MLRPEWTGGQLRDAGMATAEQAADMRIRALIDLQIDRMNALGVPWSANNIRDLMPTTQSRGLVGARVNAAANRRPAVMEKVGEEPSNLPSTHGKPINVWKGVRS